MGRLYIYCPKYCLRAWNGVWRNGDRWIFMRPKGWGFRFMARHPTHSEQFHPYFECSQAVRPFAPQSVNTCKSFSPRVLKTTKQTLCYFHMCTGQSPFKRFAVDWPYKCGNFFKYFFSSRGVCIYCACDPDPSPVGVAATGSVLCGARTLERSREKCDASKGGRFVKKEERGCRITVGWRNTHTHLVIGPKFPRQANWRPRTKCVLHTQPHF